ncbi:unnamed protein product, partial [Linum tenue]
RREISGRERRRVRGDERNGQREAGAVKSQKEGLISNSNYSWLILVSWANNKFDDQAQSGSRIIGLLFSGYWPNSQQNPTDSALLLKSRLRREASNPSPSKNLPKQMANVGESSSPPPMSNDGVKPVVVRVKRKLHQSILDAFWLEINERPSKRATLDLAKLSLGDSANGNGEESKTRKVLVQHVETISTSESTIRVVKSFVPNSVDVVEAKTTTEDRKRTFKSVNKQEQILLKSRQSQEQIAKSARFQQIWSSRKETEEEVHDMCHFYDVIRIDAESSQEKQKEALSVEDQKLLSSYLPFLKELIPDAAGEIEAEISASTSQEADEYVYDYYTVNDTMDIEHEDTPFPFPLVQVEDEDFYDGPDDGSECDSEDSNGIVDSYSFTPLARCC